MRSALVAALVCASVGTLGIAAPVQAEDADSTCGHWHGDPAPHYTGPVPLGIFCKYPIAPLVTWTVPAGLTSARFIVSGADDSSSETRGGQVDATLEVTPGSTLTLKSGGPGEASSVSLEETPLIVAGGGDGVEPNFVTPEASDVETEEPGAPQTAPFPRDGEIRVEWTYFYEGEQTPEGEDPGPEGEEPGPEGEDPGETTQDTLGSSEVPPQPFAPLPPCVVPRLKGLKPVAARKALAQAHCTLGAVNRRPARRVRRGRIVNQSVAAGSSLPAGAAVAVVVGRRP